MTRLKESAGKGITNSGRALEGRGSIPYSKRGEKEETLRDNKGKISGWDSYELTFIFSMIQDNQLQKQLLWLMG